MFQIDKVLCSNNINYYRNDKYIIKLIKKSNQIEILTI